MGNRWFYMLALIAFLGLMGRGDLIKTILIMGAVGIACGFLARMVML